MPDNSVPGPVLQFELQALRAENEGLRQNIEALRADNKLHEDFINEVSELLPPSYDADEAVEAIILSFVKDMVELGRITAKLGADYR